MPFLQSVAQILCGASSEPTSKKSISSKAPPQPEEPLPHLDVHKGTFQMVTIAAVQNLLFMMRVASAYSYLVTS
jgi:hypothetical protein